MSLRLLVTGATGQIGWQLQRTLAPLGEVIACTRAQVDLADPEAAAKFVRELAPDIVVNAAAYTAVDKAESEPELAHTVNAIAPGRIADELARTGGLLIHYSTDYVFDGTKDQPLRGETTRLGRSMSMAAPSWLVSKLIAASGCAHLILRTTWVYDIRGKNFLRTVLRLAREREELRMVGDQHGAPTWARAIAEGTAQIVARCAQRRDSSGWGYGGVFHLTAAGQTTWAGFAAADTRGLRVAGVVACRHRGVGIAPGGQARRPYHQLNSTRLRRGGRTIPCSPMLGCNRLSGCSLPDWRVHSCASPCRTRFAESAQSAPGKKKGQPHGRPALSQASETLCLRFQYVLRAIAPEGHFDQDALVLRVLGIALLGGLGLFGQRYQVALCLGLSLAVDLLEDHDVLGALHLV